MNALAEFVIRPFAKIRQKIGKIGTTLAVHHICSYIRRMKRGGVSDRKAYFASKFGPVPKLPPIRSNRSRPPMSKDPGRARERRNAVIGEVVRSIMKRRKLKARGACAHMAGVVAGLARIADPGFTLERGLGIANRRIIAIGRSRTTEREPGKLTATDELSEFLHECFRQDEKRRKRVSAAFDDEFSGPLTIFDFLPKS